VREHRTLIERIAGRCAISGDRLLQSSLLCVALHDVGKLSANFRDMMQADEKAARAARSRNYRHEIAALWLVRWLAKAMSREFGAIPGDGLLEVMAVAGHHKYLADGYLFDEERFEQELRWEPDAFTCVKAACGLASAMFKAQGWRLPKKVPGVTQDAVNKCLCSKGEENSPFQCLLSSREDLALVAERDNARSFRDLFVLFKGLLMAADWMASGAVMERDMLLAERGVVRIPAGKLIEYMKDKVDRDRQRKPSLKRFEDFKPFQKQCAQAPGHVLAIAPTGSGKTEAALLWALRQIEAGQARKLFFLLPTMVTANSLNTRMEAFFGQHGHKVALVHSTADLLYGDHRDQGHEAEADRSEVRARQLLPSHFFLPATVATVDQLLASLFHAGRWPLKTFATADAAIVIDEVHAYDPHTTGLIALLLSQIRELGARFMVMSATMPTDLQNTILNALSPGASIEDPKEVTIVLESDLLNDARNRWEICATPLTQWVKTDDSSPSPAIRQVLAEFNDRGERKRILIVVNTVKRCQEVARLLREFQPVCYHSKFIFSDRREKERLINDCQPRLVVATQVVEVSLDIDYDVLLTECAPFDALVQRAGRVNRARRPNKGLVIVFPYEEKSGKVYGEPEGILEASWRLCQENQGELTEATLVRLVEMAYAGRALSKERAFVEIQAETVAAQRRLSGVLDNPRPGEEDQLTTRLEQYHQVSVIPEQFAKAVENCESWDRRHYELKMPVWYLRKNKSELYTADVPLCRMGYDSNLGAELLSTSEEPDPASLVF
jgi:CRISPR-associated endonuclease/helicase Cas3